MSAQKCRFLSNLTDDKLAYLHQLNRIRLQLRNTVETKSKQPTQQLKKMKMNKQGIQGIKIQKGQKVLNPQDILNHLLNAQHLLYENKHHYNLDKQLKENTQNILKLIQATQHNKRISDRSKSKKSKVNVKWLTNSKKGQQKSQITKKTVKDNLNVKIGAVSSFKIVKKQQEKQQKEQMAKRTKPQFVSASTLPSNISKGTSLRKKFVPPFKKQRSQGQIQEPRKQKIGKTQGNNDDQMDPRFKNLQKKLVELIQSQIVEKNSKVQWGEIAGLGFAKKIIHQMIVWPMLRPDIFTGLRAPPKSILFFGPPGTGKTMIGRAIASEAKATFFSISASSLTSKWVGESEKLVKTLFAIARTKSPSVIFIDQIDSLLCSRKQGQQQSSRRVKTQFLVELDGAKTNNQERVLVIGATNLPQQLDDAVRRRFIKRLYIPLPNHDGRKQLITTLTNNQSFKLSNDDIEDICQLTKGYSGADLYNLCSQASLIPLRNLMNIQNIRQSQVPLASFKSFQEAIDLVKPSVNDSQLQSFQQWNKLYGSYQFKTGQLQIAKK